VTGQFNVPHSDRAFSVVTRVDASSHFSIHNKFGDPEHLASVGTLSSIDLTAYEVALFLQRSTAGQTEIPANIKSVVVQCLGISAKRQLECTVTERGVVVDHAQVLFQ
jgi:hypothetical protein